MTPEQSLSYYTLDQALDRLNVDETQLSRLTETMRAPLWYKLGDQTVYGRATIDAMVREHAVPGHAAPSPASLSLSSIIEDQAVIRAGAGSPYVRRMQEATVALLEGFRAMDGAVRSNRLSEAQAQHLADAINDLAAEMQGTVSLE